MRRFLVIVVSVVAAVLLSYGCGGGSSTQTADDNEGSGVITVGVTDADLRTVSVDGSNSAVDAAMLKLQFSGEVTGITDAGNIMLVCGGSEAATSITASGTEANTYFVSASNPCEIACESCRLTISNNILAAETSFNFENSCFVDDYFKGLFVTEDDVCWKDTSPQEITFEDVFTYNSTSGTLDFDSTGLSDETRAHIATGISLEDDFQFSFNAGWVDGMESNLIYSPDGLQIRLQDCATGAECGANVNLSLYMHPEGNNRMIGIHYNPTNAVAEPTIFDNAGYTLGQNAVMTIGQADGVLYSYYTLDGGARQDFDLTGFPADISSYNQLNLVFSDFDNINRGHFYGIESSGATAFTLE